MKQTTTPSTLSFQPRQLAGYLSGAASMAAVLAAPHAQADVIYWDPADTTATLSGAPPEGHGFRFDMLTGLITPAGYYQDVTPSAFVFWNGGQAEYTFINRTSSLDYPAVGGQQMSNLPSGSAIGPASNFGSNGTWAYFDDNAAAGYPWNTEVDGTTGYIGLRFAITGNTHYAWARFTYDDATTGNLTLHDFAYENTANVSINAGAVPEPGSALLALAGLGMVSLRRRRKAA